MKRGYILIAILFTLQLSSYAQKYNFDDLVGSWRNKEGIGLEVVDSFKIYMVYGEQKKLLQSYSTDFQSNPATFNFHVRDAKGNISIRSKLLFLNDDTIQWQVFEGETQPVSYNSERGDLFIIRKLEQKTN